MSIGRAIIAVWTVFLLVNFVFAVPYPADHPVRAAEALRAVSAAWDGWPHAEDFLAGWGNRFQAVFLAGIVVLAAVSAGRFTRLLFKVPMIFGVWVDASLGLGVFGLAVFGAGLTGLLFTEVAGTGIALIILLGVKFARGFRSAFVMPRDYSKAAGWAAGITSGLWILGVLNPDAGIDAWVYHLRIPFYYRIHHKVYYVWHQIHSHVPQVWDVVLSLFPPVLAATAAQFLSALCALSVYFMMVRCGGRPGAKLAALLVVSSPLVLSVGTGAYTDLPMMWLGFGAFMLLFHPSPDPSPARRFASGFVLALACSIKYAAFPILAAQAAWLAAESWKRRRPGWWVPAAAGFFAGFAPWLMWNFLDTGNPLFPFLGRFFPGSLAPLPFADQVSSAVFTRGWNRVLCAGWNGFVQGSPFLFLSPFFLIVLPVLLLPLRNRISPRGAGLWLAVYYAAWAVGIADERFVLAAIPVLGLAILSQAPALPSKTLFLAFFALNAAAVMREQFVTPRRHDLGRLWASVGIESHRDYFRATFDPSPGFSEAAAWVNTNTQEADRVLMVSDYKSHLIWRECIHDHVYDRPTRLLYILMKTQNDPERIAVRFHQLGIRWVMYLPTRNSSLLAEMPDRFPFTRDLARPFGRFWVTRAVRRAYFPGVTVYEIGRRPHDPSAISDLPGIQDLIFKVVEEIEAREGAGAALAQMRTYVEGYPLIGALHGMLGSAIMRTSNAPALLAEARWHLNFARRTGIMVR